MMLSTGTMSSGEDGTLMTVPEPSPAYPQPPQDLERLQKAITTMEEHGHQDDPRYGQLVALANRAKMNSVTSATPSPQPLNIPPGSGNHPQQPGGMQDHQQQGTGIRRVLFAL